MPNLAKETPSKVVDSNKEILPGPSVIALAIEHSPMTEKYPKEKMLAAVAKETTLPNTDVVQFGNTVFISHLSSDYSKAYGRAFNVDTAQNFVANGDEFVRHLNKLGVERYHAQYEGDEFDAAFKAWYRRQKKSGTEVNVIKKGGTSYAFIKIGDKVA